jgi:hypothetical protein
LVSTKIMGWDYCDFLYAIKMTREHSHRTKLPNVHLVALPAKYRFLNSSGQIQNNDSALPIRR